MKGIRSSVIRSFSFLVFGGLSHSKSCIFQRTAHVVRLMGMVTKSEVAKMQTIYSQWPILSRSWLSWNSWKMAIFIVFWRNVGKYDSPNVNNSFLHFPQTWECIGVVGSLTGWSSRNGGKYCRWDGLPFQQKDFAQVLSESVATYKARHAFYLY